MDQIIARNGLSFRRRSHAATRAFTLIELVSVLAIILLIAVLTASAVLRSNDNSRLTQAGQQVLDTISLARQEAVRRGREVRVLFVDVNESQPGWEGIQIQAMTETATGPEEEPLTKVALLPAPITVSTNSVLSPLLTSGSSVHGGLEESGPYTGKAYRGFRIRPSGSLDSYITPADNFITLQNANLKGSPANFYTIQINTVTGSELVFRP